MTIRSNKLSVVAGYPGLVKNIQSELSGLELFVKRRMTETYWKIGRFIHEHLLENKERADYGHALFEQLAKDVGRDKSSLLRVVQFYRTYPNVATWRQLTWSHYRTLISIKDDGERRKLEKKIVSKDWDNRQLAAYLREKRAAQEARILKDGPVPQLEFTRGALDCFEVVKDDGNSGGEGLVLDFG